MIQTTRFTRRGAYAAVTAMLCAAPAIVTAQTETAQPPAGGASAEGQPPAGGPGMGGRGGRGGRGAAMLLEGITLTDAQRTTIDSIQAANRARMMDRMQTMRSQAQQGGAAPDSATRAQFRQEMMREQESQRTAMRAVLTPDQQKTFDANVARVRDMMQQRMREGGPGGMGPGGRGRD